MSVRLCVCLWLFAACGGLLRDARPGSARPISVLIYAREPEVREPAREILTSYARVTVDVIDALTPDAMLSVLNDGCAQAQARGLEYFGIARLDLKHHFKEECVRLEHAADVVYPAGAKCADMRHVDQATTATFHIDFYDAKVCTLRNAPKVTASGHAKGPPETSDPEARDQALARALADARAR